MNATELRELTPLDLGARVTEWQEELFRMRCNQAIGQTADAIRIRAVRRDIARAKTIINEMQRHAASQG